MLHPRHLGGPSGTSGLLLEFFFFPQGRSFTWLGEDEVTYSNWKDDEPKKTAGCGHMTTSGQWTMTPCDAKLDAAICRMGGGCAREAEVCFWDSH